MWLLWPCGYWGYAALTVMQSSWPCRLSWCNLCGHAVWRTMRSMWPCGLRDHVVRGCRLLTINIACLPCLVVRALLLQTDLIGAKTSLSSGTTSTSSLSTRTIAPRHHTTWQINTAFVVTFAISSSGGVVGYLTLQGDSYTIRYNPIPNVT